MSGGGPLAPTPGCVSWIMRDLTILDEASESSAHRITSAELVLDIMFRPYVTAIFFFLCGRPSSFVTRRNDPLFMAFSLEASMCTHLGLDVIPLLTEQLVVANYRCYQKKPARG